MARLSKCKGTGKCWCRKDSIQPPEELQSFLKRHSLTKDIMCTAGYPEKMTRLDGFGKGRQHDMILIGENGGEQILLSIEAKADESYGELAEAAIRRAASNSNLPHRIELLKKAILGEEAELSGIRYQLLHGAAGALIEAKLQNAAAAIFLVHQFLSPQLDAGKIERSNQDLNLFLSALLKREICLENGDLAGPVMVPGGEFVPVTIPFYIGKVVTLLK